MTNFKQYFRSHLNANFKPLLFIFVTVLVLTLLIGVIEQPSSRYYKGEIFQDYNSTLYIPVIFLCVLAYALPVMEFSFFKKRINLDCFYSLPISRRTMGTVHYLTGLLILFGTFTLSYLLNFMLLLIRGPGWFKFTPMIPHYFLCLLLGFAMYSVMVFVFNEANTMGDGIWFMVLYTFVFAFMAYTFRVVTGIGTEIFDESPVFIPWYVISIMTQKYQRIVEIEGGGYFWREPEYVCGFAFCVAIGIVSAIGLFLAFGKRRTEKTEEISDSWFGFRTLIPIYAICGALVFKGMSYIILWISFDILALIGYTVYRRGFHYKISDIGILILCILISLNLV